MKGKMTTNSSWTEAIPWKIFNQHYAALYNDYFLEISLLILIIKKHLSTSLAQIWLAEFPGQSWISTLPKSQPWNATYITIYITPSFIETANILLILLNSHFSCFFSMLTSGKFKKGMLWKNSSDSYFIQKKMQC